MLYRHCIDDTDFEDHLTSDKQLHQRVKTIAELINDPTQKNELELKNNLKKLEDHMNSNYDKGTFKQSDRDKQVLIDTLEENLKDIKPSSSKIFNNFVDSLKEKYESTAVVRKYLTYVMAGLIVAVMVIADLAQYLAEVSD